MLTAKSVQMSVGDRAGQVAVGSRRSTTPGVVHGLGSSKLAPRTAPATKNTLVIPSAVSGLRCSSECITSGRARSLSLSENVRKATTRARGGHSGPTREVTKMMPIGVPKVPYRTPKENSWQWVDLWNCLYRERIVFVGAAIDEEMSNQMVGTLLYLDSVDKGKDIMLYINSPGGDVVPTLAIHDTMQACKSDVGCLSFGGALAMAGFLLATGKKGKRAVLPNTKIMLHQPSGAARGQAADIYNEAKELLRLRQYMSTVLAKAVDKPVPEVAAKFQRDTYFSPQEAQEYGIIDNVIYPKAKFDY